jgi:hypothetical protein
MNENVYDTLKVIDYSLDQVNEFGWTDKSTSIDNFEKLRKDHHFKEFIVAGLYEEYFLPDRHEHEWQILNEIVTAIVNSPSTEIVVNIVISGVVGNAAYDLLKELCRYTNTQYKKIIGKKAHERAECFLNIANDSEILLGYFKNKKKSRIIEIEEGTGLPREKIYLLLKLAGFTHYRRGEKTCYWENPSIED